MIFDWGSATIVWIRWLWIQRAIHLTWVTLMTPYPLPVHKFYKLHLNRNPLILFRLMICRPWCERCICTVTKLAEGRCKPFGNTRIPLPLASRQFWDEALAVAPWDDFDRLAKDRNYSELTAKFGPFVQELPWQPMKRCLKKKKPFLFLWYRNRRLFYFYFWTIGLSFSGMVYHTNTNTDL